MSRARLIQRTTQRITQRGLSIIELMIGVAVGLFIVAGGAKLLADGLIGNRRIAVESRMAQDLRAATDVIARDIRRAGYWEGSLDGVSATPVTSAYGVLSPSPGAASSPSVTYRYARDGDNAIDTGTEVFTFERMVDANGIGFIGMRIGSVNAFQPLTDTGTVNITDFEVAAVTSEVSLGDKCLALPAVGGVSAPACCRPDETNGGLCKPDVVERAGANYLPTTGYAPGSKNIRAACPQLVVRRFNIRLRGVGLGPNVNVVREIHESVRVRNDQIDGTACPP